MNAASADARPADVWASTWIPGPSPVEGLGDESGYSLAFVRVRGGPMLQVVVDGDAAPEPGVVGHVRALTLEDGEIDVFTPATGADA